MASERKQSDTSRAFSEDGALKTHVGGQALLEGIMMRGKYNWSVAVREPAGTIYIEEHDLTAGADKDSWLHWPFVRGVRAFVDLLVLGYKALSIAAEHAFEEDGEGNLMCYSPENEISRSADSSTSKTAASRTAATPPSAVDNLVAALEAAEQMNPTQKSHAESISPAAEPDPKKESAFGGKEMTISLVMGLVLGIVLFVVAPAFITNLIVGEYDQHTLVWNIIDGIIRIAIFIFYIWLIGRMEDIKRMFGYHGAEHKTIHCFEHGLDLTPENARSFPRLHVRCGTAFLIMVMILAIFIYTVIPLDGLIAALGIPDGPAKLAFVIFMRILFLPIIAGIAYEITVKWAGTHPDNPVVKVILWPGLQMQRLTTCEPDDGQIECAIEAMKAVLLREQAEEA